MDINQSPGQSDQTDMPQMQPPVELEGWSPLDEAIDNAVDALKADQHGSGYWCYEFEADCTIPAEYILMMHFMDEVDAGLEEKIGVYLRNHQDERGGWPLYLDGEADLSCTVKCYYALKLIGDDPHAEHMLAARDLILAMGGAAHANVFTHITLALFAQIPWDAVPFIPVEIILLPKWFPFHLSKVSYWSRTVMVPLFILCTLKPQAANPRKVDVSELFVIPPFEEQDYFPVRSGLNRCFYYLDQVGRYLEPLVPGFIRARAIRKAREWFVERLNGDAGLGGIFPAMANAHEALRSMGFGPEHPLREQTRAALCGLLVVKETQAYCQPCLSPVWDTGLAALALQEAVGGDDTDVRRALNWIAPLQLLNHPGDWRESRPALRGGGWAFEFRNDHYPDIDDTPVVAWAMLNSDGVEFSANIERAAEWICGMQSHNGGWASFDVDNTCYYLNEIPFADHGALLDPPTVDVTARCIGFLSKLDRERFRRQIDRGLAFIRSEQQPEGCWFGRWGTNYIYGTWSVLMALEMAGESPQQAYIQRAVAWLDSVQRDDGGWGETNYSYFEPREKGKHDKSTSVQTAWAVMGLIAAGQGNSKSVQGGIRYLLGQQNNAGLWFDRGHNAPGFPRVFYLKYHGYDRYFPLWALARYRNSQAGG